jgi:hypothetical protein
MYLSERRTIENSANAVNPLGCRIRPACGAGMGRKRVYRADSRGYKLPPQAARNPTAQDLIPGSSAVEQPAVNREVVGSNPTGGAYYEVRN